MNTAAFRPLVLAWAALVALTLISLVLGQGFRDIPGLPWLVGAIIWLKGLVVARAFLESRQAHPFIRRLLLGFIAFPPLALIATLYASEQIARWFSL